MDPNRQKKKTKSTKGWNKGVKEAIRNREMAKYEWKTKNVAFRM